MLAYKARNGIAKATKNRAKRQNVERKRRNKGEAGEAERIN